VVVEDVGLMIRQIGLDIEGEVAFAIVKVVIIKGAAFAVAFDGRDGRAGSVIRLWLEIERVTTKRGGFGYLTYG
jgi:hypothetical protein